jgi:acyl carrier protein
MAIRELIRRFIAESLLYGSDASDLSDDASFLQEGIVDSTGVIELVLFVEETFGFEIEDDDIMPANFDSISSLATYIAQRAEL